MRFIAPGAPNLISLKESSSFKFPRLAGRSLRAVPLGGWLRKAMLDSLKNLDARIAYSDQRSSYALVTIPREKLLATFDIAGVAQAYTRDHDRLYYQDPAAKVPQNVPRCGELAWRNSWFGTAKVVSETSREMTLTPTEVTARCPSLFSQIGGGIGVRHARLFLSGPWRGYFVVRSHHSYICEPHAGLAIQQHRRIVSSQAPGERRYPLE